MSGGSWDYIYGRFEETAERLRAERDPLRRALGDRIALIAAAMRDIEWVDSGDYGKGDDVEAIRKALGEGGDAEVMRLLIDDAKKAGEALNAAIAAAEATEPRGKQ